MKHSFHPHLKLTSVSLQRYFLISSKCTRSDKYTDLIPINAIMFFSLVRISTCMFFNQLSVRYR